MSDPQLILEENGGDLVIEGGDLVISNGLESAVILSMFGGNQSDGGTDGDRAFQYWGNVIEDDPNRWLRSQTQYILERTSATSGNLLRVQQAVEQDLAWMQSVGIATSIVVDVELTGVKRIRILINVEVNGEEYNFETTREWGGTS